MNVQRIREALEEPFRQYDLKEIYVGLTLWECGCILLEKYKEVNPEGRFKYKPCGSHSALLLEK